MNKAIERSKLSRSTRKFLRRRKAEIRRELPPEQAELEIARLNRSLLQ